jgi:hypothetical protein
MVLTFAQRLQRAILAKLEKLKKQETPKVSARETVV